MGGNGWDAGGNGAEGRQGVPSPSSSLKPFFFFFGEVIAFTPVGDLARFNHSISSPGQLHQIGQINRGSTGGALGPSLAPPPSAAHFFSLPSPSSSSCLSIASTKGGPNRTRNPTWLQSPVWTEKTGSRELFGGFFPPFCEGKLDLLRHDGTSCWGLQVWETAAAGRPDLFSTYKGAFQLFRVGLLMADIPSMLH